MDKAVLKAQKRDKSVKAKSLRADGVLPAEYYGAEVDNLSLKMDYQDFRKLYRATGDNTVIDLEVEGAGNKKVLVQNVDYDPVTNKFLHVEFINVRMDQEVTTTLPIRLEGDAPAVKELAGVLVQNLDELEVRCLPADLLHELVVNVEPLEDFSSAIHVSDLDIPEKITVLTDPERTVATVSAPREEEPEEVPEEDVDSVEIEGEEKSGDEEGGESDSSGNKDDSE